MTTQTGPLPSVSDRALAALIDYGIYGAFYFSCTVFLTSSSAFHTPNQPASPMASLLTTVFWLLYFPLSEAAFQKTLGKALYGLRVLKVDGSALHLKDTFKRHIADSVDFFGSAGIAAIIAAGRTDLRQRLGDLWAQTVVVGDTTVTCPRCEERVSIPGSETLRSAFTCPACQASISWESV